MGSDICLFDVQQDKFNDDGSQPAKERGSVGCYMLLISLTVCSPTLDDVALLLVLPQAAIKSKSYLFSLSLLFIIVRKEKKKELCLSPTLQAVF